MPDDNIISSKVVSEKVIGSANPIARFGRNMKSSFSGIITGILLIIGGIILCIVADSINLKTHKTISALELKSADSISADQTGMVKINGRPTLTIPLVTPKTQAPSLYYDYTVEELKRIPEKKERTQTVTRDGQDIEQTIEETVCNDQWQNITSDNKIAEFKLGPIIIKGENAKTVFDLSTVYNKDTDRPALPGEFDYNICYFNPKIGKPANSDIQGELLPIPTTVKMREIVRVIPPDYNMIVVGELNGGLISSGNPFIISNQTNDALIATVKGQERMTYWIMKLISFLLLMIGFTMLVGPLLALTSVIPGIAQLASLGVYLVSGILALVIVVLLTVLVKFWYLIIILLIALIVWLIVKAKNKKA